MDDFVISNLRESKNEWCCYLVDIMTPLVAQGIRSIFQQAFKMCAEKDEVNKYLMTFQNLLSLVAKWNSTTIEEERKRIVEQSGCSYLEELIVCVHIIHLKVMTHIRVGNKQKKVDISLPKLDDFVHKTYIHVARRVYKNVYLFEMGVDSLTQQKYNRELEMIVQESILSTVRDSIPKEQIIRSFMDETVEQEEEVIVESVKPVVAEVTKTETDTKKLDEKKLDEKKLDEKTLAEKIPDEKIPETVPSITNVDDKMPITKLTFNDFDSVMDMGDNKVEEKYAPKTIDHLEKISVERAQKRKQEEEEEDRLKISSESLSLSDLGIIQDMGSAPIATPVSSAPMNDLVTLLDIQEI